MTNSSTSACVSDPAGAAPKNCSRAAEHQAQRQAGEAGAQHLGRRVRRHLLPGEASAGGEGDGDGGVEVRAGDVAERVDQDHDHHPPHGADAGKRHHAVGAQVHHHGPAPSEDHEVRTQNLCDDLIKYS
jgi:hypothetical protein